MYTKFWSENLEERDHSERSSCRYKDRIRMDVGEIWWKLCTGYM
jgi:hypothetical protein